MSDGACRSLPGRITCQTAIAIASSISDRYFYRYGNDGLVYRFDRANSLVSSVIPLMSSGLFLGEPLPLGYDVYNDAARLSVLLSGHVRLSLSP